jgi:hypothetical protein
MAPLVNLSSTHLPPSSLDPESQAKCSSPMKAKEAGIFISKEERANLDSLVEKISNDGNWQGDKSVCELLVLVVNDEDFLRALKDTVFKLKKDVNVTADETADKHSLLSALLEEPANPTPVETADFLRLIKGELATHPDKWANTLSTFTQATTECELLATVPRTTSSMLMAILRSMKPQSLQPLRLNILTIRGRGRRWLMAPGVKQTAR